MILKIFTQPKCPNCPPAKKLGKEAERLSGGGKKLKVEYFDVLTVDGLAEASFYTVMATPSLVFCDGQGKAIKIWRGEVPSIDELKKLIR